MTKIHFLLTSLQIGLLGASFAVHAADETGAREPAVPEVTPATADADDRRTHPGTPSIVLDRQPYDVAVFGATPAGIAAAIAARREGIQHVVLADASAHVGGRFAETIGFGEVQRMEPETVGGLWTELRAKVDAHYGKETGTPEPHVMEQILVDWLGAEGVVIADRFLPVRADKEGARLVRIHSDDRGFIEASVFIDATYYGDLLPVAGVSFTIGRESRALYGESLAGVLLKLVDPPGPIDIPVMRSPISGLAADGKTLLPHVQGLTTDVREGDGDTHLQCANLYACLTKDPANRVELTEPQNYDPAEFELLRRELARLGEDARFGFGGGVPHDKAKMNDGVNYLLHWGLAGGADAYPAATPEERRRIWETHRDYTHRLLWFLRTDASVLESIRQNLQQWGLPKDEFTDNGHWPYDLYAREGRRMIGDFVMTQRDLFDDIAKPDAIALGCFPVDSHVVRRLATPDGKEVVNEGGYLVIPPIYEIPYRALTPKATECDNLLVTCALSSSRVAFNSLRVEPTWMMLGQAAGIAAAMTQKDKRPAQGVNTAELQRRLLEASVPFQKPNPAETFDIVLANGRIVDGTGSPWYVADVGIKDGRITRIGRLGAEQATRRIDASGLIVAPGFIDMMGQTATPLIGKPERGFNLLTQGITTINTGEGASGAPLSEEAAGRAGWRTMAEYFQVLDSGGLPVNVTSSVGLTQVRSLVMGVQNRKPAADELERMKDLVREAMEAGAIGVSTALIYPPGTYADTDELAALAAVAGEYGGRYLTHLRNEGDELLEAIDEALEIGSKGGTPVHIFHLKTAGRGNWSKMDAAVARIRAARAAGAEVTADIYPYVNNGLSIGALVHPRHFENGREALLGKLDDPALRQVIRREMESDDGGWENWYKHIGRDWDKLIIGGSHSVRHQIEPGLSLAAAAARLNLDPWDLFFHLVGTGAFVMPETMSEANKMRLIGEDFISFCTDVGPAVGSGVASHPRGYGSFPRLLSRYVRDGGATTLERAVAQASALAANAIMARDRGRIAEGLAADVIAFDYENLADHADFAHPDKPSEGMKFVIVNGMLALDNGRQTEARPGRVLRGPGWKR